MKLQYEEREQFDRCHKERDLFTESENAKNELKNQLIESGFLITNPLYIDGFSNTQQKEKVDEWSYVARFQKDKDGKSYLKCSARFTRTGKRCDFSIPIQEIKRKEK